VFNDELEEAFELPTEEEEEEQEQRAAGHLWGGEEEEAVKFGWRAGGGRLEQKRDLLYLLHSFSLFVFQSSNGAEEGLAESSPWWEEKKRKEWKHEKCM
jgi:hypothetical protein